MAGTSSGAHSTAHPTVAAAAFAPAWLPPGGRGNGLPAPSWAPIADLDARDVDTVLAALLDAHVPAHAAPAPRPVRPLTSDRWVRGAVWRLRVGSSSYGKAENVLLNVLRAGKRGRLPP
ncbi:hypothetical protein ABZ858_06645 [Streptomyces sp. NPDC047017]|uniref:hypothetical protein n=1 Tax=Streptomyces sp. NPDC047017 TaxID=3155024 RepID=UPI0033FD4285